MLRRLLLAAGTVLLALACAEGISRLRFRKAISVLAFTESDLYYYYGPDGIRRHIPGKIGYERMWNGRGKAEFRINALGLRGKDLDMPKPTGTRRVLLLGDSITLGGRLPEEDSFVARVGRALERDAPGRFDVANGGVGDVGLAEEEYLLRRIGPRLQPDLVVLCWFLNDGRPPVGFPEETIYRNPAVRWLHRRAWLQRSYLMGVLYDALRKRLLVRRLATMEGESRRFDWVEPYNAGRWAADPKAFEDLVRLARFDWGDAWAPESRRSMEGRLRRIRALAERLGARFALVALPVHAQVYAGFESPLLDAPQAWLRDFSRREGIPFLDPLPPLRKRRGEPLYYDHCHYTPGGNEIMAEGILRFLRETELVSG